MKTIVSLVTALLLGTALAWCDEGKMNEIIEKAKKLQERYKADVKTLTIDSVMQYEKDSKEKMKTGDGAECSEFKSKTYMKGDNFRYSLIVEGEKDGKKEAFFENHFVKNGEAMWTVTTLVGKRKAKDYLKEAKNSDYLTSWKLLDEQGKYVGEETVDGKPCYIVELKGLEGVDGKKKAKKDEVQTVWLSKDTLTAVKMRYQQKKDTIEMKASEFKTVKGWEFPYRMDFSSNGKPSFSMIVNAVKVNEPMDDSIFDADKIEVQKIEIKTDIKKDIKKDVKKDLMKGFIGGALGR